MRFEDLKYDFPKMPQEMRTMIEKEVEKQIKTEQVSFSNGRKAAGKVLAASLAAVMLLGTTVFAGVSIYRMQREQVSEHGVNVKVREHSGETAQEADAADKRKPQEIPNVKMEIGYLPDGMVQTDEGKYSYENALHKGGISITFYRMDTGDSQYEMLHQDVLSSEDISVNGFDGVYLEYPHLYEEEIAFNQRIYAAFTDVHYVMEMYAASDVSKEEALKIAESIRLVPTDGEGDKNLIRGWDWSAYLASEKEDARQENTAAQEETAERTSVSKEEMKHTHAVGESFSLENPQADEKSGLTAKVTDVQVTDDISLLDLSKDDEDFRAETDSSGKLKPAVIQYIKNGNLDSLSEVVKSRKVPQKLVYVTVEYTNTGDRELNDVLFFGSLERIYEKDGQMRMMPGGNYEEVSDTDAWNQVANRGLSSRFEMPYYDVHGGERNNNYIESVKPGETVTVHMAWTATQEELGNLYVSLDTYGGAGAFTDTSLAMGYVDIRQACMRYLK